MPEKHIYYRLQRSDTLENNGEGHTERVGDEAERTYGRIGFATLNTIEVGRFETAHISELRLGKLACLAQSTYTRTYLRRYFKRYEFLHIRSGKWLLYLDAGKGTNKKLLYT